MVLSHWPHVAEQVEQQVAELVEQHVASVKALLINRETIFNISAVKCSFNCLLLGVEIARSFVRRLFAFKLYHLAANRAEKRRLVSDLSLVRCRGASSRQCVCLCSVVER